MAVDPVTAQAITDELVKIDNASAAIYALIATTTPPDPPDPPLPPVEHSLVVPASALALRDVVAMIFDVDHIGVWGNPGEAVEFTVRLAGPGTIQVALDYALASEAQSVPSYRAVLIEGQGRSVSLPATGATWAEKPRRWSDRTMPMAPALPAGDHVIRITRTDTAAWTNWADLYAVGVTSSQPITLVTAAPIPPTPTPIPPTPSPGTYDAVVGRDGTLQEIVDRLGMRPMLIGVPPGIWATNRHIFTAVNRIFPDEGLRIVLEPGAELHGYNGIEPWGCQNIHIWSADLDRKGRIRVAGYDAGNVYGNGFYGENRVDKGATPGGVTGRISLRGLDIGPIPGTGILARAGLSVWTCDLVAITDNDIHDCSGTAEGLGGAASGISVGHGRALPGGSGPRVLIARNRIWNQIGCDGSDSYDRNAIIMDLFHGGASGLYSDRVRGDIVIEDNECWDLWGRGVELLVAGTNDSPVYVRRNLVHGFYADHLAGSNPIAGIGGYGFGHVGNVHCHDNDVIPHGSRATYRWEAFGQFGGVQGANNKTHGGRTEWINSPTNTAPAGFFV